jgi:hypothetical protein
MALASAAGEVLIEKEENYIKQSYRNRFEILTSNGPLSLSVPVLIGSFHKTPVKEIRIDYSKRWQQVHLGAITASYRSSPYYEFYFEKIRDVIMTGHTYLLDLNMHSLEALTTISGINTKTGFTSRFIAPGSAEGDFRYLISPKKNEKNAGFRFGKYNQVFSDRTGFLPGLSTIDLVFNTGPDTPYHLRGTTLINN